VAIGAGIVLSFTRGVWIGCAVGAASIAFMLPRKQLVALLAPVALVALLAAGPIYYRLSMSTWDNFTPDTGRRALVRAGVAMVQDHPFFGVGPDRIQDEFPRYHTPPPELKGLFYGHMENNFMQIAAERGLITLAAFLWFYAELFVGLWRRLKHNGEMVRASALSSLAVLTGFLVAGLFSYDFGDSETLLLFLFLVSIPFGLTSDARRSGDSLRIRAQMPQKR
jgi:O-antigen ligase